MKPQTIPMIRSPFKRIYRYLWMVCSIVTAFLLFICPQRSLSARTKPTEYEVKAVYLYNFGKFVQWPAVSKSTEPFVICVLGNNPFGTVLESTISGEKIDRISVQVKQITSIQKISSCRMLFISSSEADRVPLILEAAQHTPVLTVSDIPQFAERGGMIGFVMEGDRVRFAVNLAAVQRAGLKLSSELLKVAVKVVGTPGSGE